jgi:hypothetical protein
MTILGFNIEKTFNLGHFITIVTVVVGLSMGWATIAGQTAENTKAIVAGAIKNDQQDDQLTALLAIINAERLEQQKLLTEMRVDIRYLRRAVETEKREAGEDSE